MGVVYVLGFSAGADLLFDQRFPYLCHSIHLDLCCDCGGRHILCAWGTDFQKGRQFTSGDGEFGGFGRLWAALTTASGNSVRGRASFSLGVGDARYRRFPAILHPRGPERIARGPGHRLDLGEWIGFWDDNREHSSDPICCRISLSPSVYWLVMHWAGGRGWIVFLFPRIYTEKSRRSRDLNQRFFSEWIKIFVSPPKYSGTGAFGALDIKTSSQPPVRPGVTIVPPLRGSFSYISSLTLNNVNLSTANSTDFNGQVSIIKNVAPEERYDYDPG